MPALILRGRIEALTRPGTKEQMTNMTSGKILALGELRHRIALLERGGRAGTVLPFGIAALDTALPGGGLPLGACHELRGVAAEAEEGVAAAGFLAGILARLAPPRPVLWCLPNPDLYPPGLAFYGLAPERLILLRARGEAELLWAMEEGLRSAALAAVVGELDQLSSASSRRLQLASESTGVTGFALRRPRRGRCAAEEPLAAATRWRVSALPARDAGMPGLSRPRWRLELLRCRGGRPGIWEVEAGNAQGHVSLATELADRPAEAAKRTGTAG
jgi:protein ImuA